ncbi:MAG TPA: type II toxin-antitoxin system VapC family toxin [Terriglobia bacterium]|nr:type II toxin-antitoxin system VapC family toxin [Terriglobia bacterium]
MILDTNALSAIAEDDHDALKEVSKANVVAIPVIVLGEYRFGISESRHRDRYERWLEKRLALSRVLEVNEVTSIHYAAIRRQLKKVGKPIPSNDIWIAALCRENALPVLSRDRHFDLVDGVKRISW